MCYFLSYLFSRPFQQIEKEWSRTSRRIGLLFWSILFYSCSGFFRTCRKTWQFQIQLSMMRGHERTHINFGENKRPRHPFPSLFLISLFRNQFVCHKWTGQFIGKPTYHIIAGKLVPFLYDGFCVCCCRAEIVLYAKFWMARPVFSVFLFFSWVHAVRDKQMDVPYEYLWSLISQSIINRWWWYYTWAFVSVRYWMFALADNL